jgi:hypothetical protein
MADIRCTTSRTGSHVTFRNTSTGTFSGATWTVIKVNLLPRVSVVVATSHASGGFTAGVAGGKWAGTPHGGASAIVSGGAYYTRTASVVGSTLSVTESLMTASQVLPRQGRAAFLGFLAEVRAARRAAIVVDRSAPRP